MSSFIPSLHFASKEKKLTEDWWDEVVQHYYYQTHLINLLQDKDVEEIDGYADGNYDMRIFKRMFRSLRNQMIKGNNPNMSKDDIMKMDKIGINWDRVPLIAPKLNSAIATTQKIPLEVTCVCTDPLAQRKKKEDLEFLRNKSMMEQELQPLYDSLNLGKVDMGKTKHSSVPYTSLPLDLDIEDEQEFMLFANVIYNLAPEAAFETILNLFTKTKKLAQIRLLETRDQYKYAVSAHRVFDDKMTGLPDMEYIHPGNISTDGSRLNDYSDRVITIEHKIVTPMELFKYFPGEIKSEDQLEEIVGTSHAGDWDNSYCCKNQRGRLDRGELARFKMHLKYIEVKSVDSIGVGKKAKSGYEYFTDDESKTTEKVWAQNTYCCYWLANTKYFFGIDVLDYAYRSEGNEKYQCFSTNINKTQEKSAVELSIGENKKAQIADIKLQHALIMSMPTGKVIDMKYIRNFLESLTDEGDKYTEQDLLDMAMEKNIHLIDTEGFEGKQNAGQYLPVRDLPGGIKSELEGYYRVFLEADTKISQYTNINQQLTGQSANPEGLVGLQKLLINSSINGLYYVYEALEAQYTAAYNILASLIKRAIDNGGKTKAAIEAIIGTNKVEIIDGMKDLPLHQVGVWIKLGQREEERANFQRQVEKMNVEGKIDTAALYYILNQPNPKDAFMLAAMFERKYNKKKEAQFAAQLESQQKMVEQQGQNALQNTQAQTDGKIQQIGAEVQGEAELMKLGSQLGLSKDTLNGLIKRQLQDRRMDGQVDKSLKTLYAKNNLEQQEPLIV